MASLPVGRSFLMSQSFLMNFEHFGDAPVMDPVIRQFNKR